MGQKPTEARGRWGRPKVCLQYWLAIAQAEFVSNPSVATSEPRGNGDFGLVEQMGWGNLGYLDVEIIPQKGGLHTTCRGLVSGTWKLC